MVKKLSHTRVKIVFFLAVLFLVGLSVFSFLQVKKLIHTSKWVNHTNEVQLGLDDLYATLTDMEANKRGYILTNDTTFLNSYYKDAKIIPAYLNTVDSLTKDNILQQANVIQLKKLVAKRQAYMQQVLAEVATKPISIQLVLEGKALMDDIRTCIGKMKNEEDALFAQRSVMLDKETDLTPKIALMLVLSALLIVLGAYIKIMRDLRESDLLKQEVEIANEELQLKNIELKKNEEQFFKMFDNNPVALSFGEIGNNKIAYANKLFYNYFGYTAAEVIGHTSEELGLVSPEENARLLPLILGMLEENRSVAELRALPPEETEKLLIKLREKMFGNGFEVLYTRKNKETFYALIFYEVIEIGKKKYTLTSYQDVTERRKNEKRIERQNEDLLKMNKELESFNYISSHDLQEPLRKIQMLTSQIAAKDEQNLSDKGKELFKRIQDSAHKMRALIEDLLAYSRTNAADRKFETVPIKKIIDEIQDDLKDEILHKHATLEIGELLEARIIPFQFRQLIYNLISNALKFTTADRTPCIKINAEINTGEKLGNEKLAPKTTYYHISVADNGIGFEPQYAEKIFEVFQRLHKKSDYSGTGIGLAIVKKIVDNHNGFISAQGQPNQGARFDIYLPV